MASGEASSVTSLAVRSRSVACGTGCSRFQLMDGS